MTIKCRPAYELANSKEINNTHKNFCNYAMN